MRGGLDGKASAASALQGTRPVAVSRVRRDGISEVLGLAGASLSLRSPLALKKAFPVRPRGMLSI